MTRSTRSTRRRLLASAGTGSVLVLAGCADPDDEGGADDEPDAEEGTGNGQDIEDEQVDAGDDDPGAEGTD